jgi:hypothetical protein
MQNNALLNTVFRMGGIRWNERTEFIRACASVGGVDEAEAGSRVTTLFARYVEEWETMRQRLPLLCPPKRQAIGTTEGGASRKEGVVV